MRPDETFITLVREVLDHLYDYPYLQTHPLADRLFRDRALSPKERMRLLRSTVLASIEELSPGPDEPFRSLRARPYSVLNLRYVEGMSIAELARELAVSERQVYRDLRRAEESLAALLWARCTDGQSPPGPQDSRARLVLAEAQRLPVRMEDTCLQTLAADALDAVARLAEQRGVSVRAGWADVPSIVVTDRVLAKQALVAALSHAVQQAASGTAVLLTISEAGLPEHVKITFVPAELAAPAQSIPIAAQQLLARIGGGCAVTACPDGQSQIRLFLCGAQATSLLVIDDNEGLVELFRRYLLGQDYALVGACSAQEGLRLAREIRPGVIVLDVMMPGQDGWEVLRQLRTDERTRGIPVVVCSVLDDPQLALSLGATEFLAKPVSQEQLLATLDRCRRRSCPQSRPTALADI